jgi:glycosyltransferase involved in cell wall biosynthesis
MPNKTSPFPEKGLPNKMKKFLEGSALADSLRSFRRNDIMTEQNADLYSEDLKKSSSHLNAYAENPPVAETASEVVTPFMQENVNDNMSRTNVLWVIDHVCYDGSLHGGGRLYWNVLPHFDANRFQIIACMLRASDEIREIFAKSPVPVTILDKGKFDPTTLWTLLRLIKEHRIDVVHLHCYGASTFGRLAGLMSGVPTIIHDYDTEIYFPYPWYLGLADRALAPITRSAIAASPMVRHFQEKRRRINNERISLMLHAIPAEKYAAIPQEKVLRTRERLNIDSSMKIVGTVTKLGPQRGNKIFLQAAARVLTSLPNARFLMLYKPTYFHRLPNQRYVPVSASDMEIGIAKLETLARELGVEKNVQFIEWSENSDELISVCDVIVAPFLSERFSSVHILEAMAMGKPVIATALGEQREIVENGINGYLVAPQDVQELAERMLGILAQPDELDRLGRRAREKAEQYSVESYVQKLQSLYRALAANGSSKVNDDNIESVR